MSVNHVQKVILCGILWATPEAMSTPDVVVGTPQPKTPACTTMAGMTRSSNSASTSDDCVPPSQSSALGQEIVGVLLATGSDQVDRLVVF